MSGPHLNTQRAIVLILLSLFLWSTWLSAQAPPLSNLEKLGKAIFFDQNLSIQKNQACAACHAPEAGWTGPIELVNSHGSVYEGSIFGRFGDRKPPSSAYATQSPILSVDKHGLWVGGNFWDGRATGEKLGNPAADQAQGPFLNPAEQALPDSACVVYRVCNGIYPVSFESVMGSGACAITWPDNIETVCQNEGVTVELAPSHRAKSNFAYDEIALAIAAYEASPEVNAFSSKFDYARKGKTRLTTDERKGLALFKGKGKCAKCHISTGQNALFTDYTFDNLGIPKNPENPVYERIPEFLDLGSGGFLEHKGFLEDIFEPELGKVKVPTLRNVDKRPYPGFVKAFGHNGYFKSLEEIVHFYNTRDVLPTCAHGSPGEKVTCWPAPEYPWNVNTAELGNLGLSPAEEAAIVEFLKTLSDGHTPD
jgi:cytochrome c peroxidase